MGRRKASPDDRLREAIHCRTYWIASSLALLAMTIFCHSGAARSDEPGIHNHHREYGFRACATWRIPE